MYIPSLQLAKIIAIVSLLVASMVYAYNWHTSEVDKAVTSAVNAIKVEQQKQTIKLLDKQQELNINLQEKYNALQTKNKIDIADLNDKYYSAITGLRYRPSRTDSSNKSSADKSTCVAEVTRGCYPNELYREDSELVINIAKQAEVIRLDLLSCYKQYDDLKEAVDNLK